jgi:hypothetical protein
MTQCTFRVARYLDSAYRDGGPSAALTATVRFPFRRVLARTAMGTASTASPPSRTLMHGLRNPGRAGRPAAFGALQRSGCRGIRDNLARHVAYFATALAELSRILRHHDSLCRGFCDNRPAMSRIPRQPQTIEPGKSTSEPTDSTIEPGIPTNEPSAEQTNPAPRIALI